MVKKYTFHYLAISIFLIFSFSNCDLEKEVDLELPTYENQLVVECYLEVGLPFSAVISESVSFFADPGLPFISGATVTITHQGVIYTLGEGIYFDSTGTKLFNYGSSFICPANYGEDFTISVSDGNGRVASATTQILEPILIDTLETVWMPDDTTKALVFTRFQDPPEKENFYRRMFQSGGIIGEGKDEQDFTTTDNFATTDNEIVFGTGFDFMKGDTVISTLFHIDQAFYDFKESVQSAINSNGNPFGQPSVIKSNIDGGIGIFTGLSYDRKVLIID
ncbi:MAG: DUF4249 domain-containing protein [Saprospiraceae bacterium]